MKRIVSLLLACALWLCAAAFAEKSENLFETKYYTMRAPEGWVCDYDDLKKEEKSWELGYIFRKPDYQLCVFAGLDYYSNWSDVSLWRGREEDMREYKDVLLKDYKDYSPELVETVTVGKIPFLVMKLTDNDAVFYYAETMTNGYAVSFEYYALDARSEWRNVTDEEYRLFIEMLKTFEPKL